MSHTEPHWVEVADRPCQFPELIYSIVSVPGVAHSSQDRRTWTDKLIYFLLRLRQSVRTAQPCGTQVPVVGSASLINTFTSFGYRFEHFVEKNKYITC